jgi:hypothetical protein
MLYSEIIAVCSEIHTKHRNTLCGQNVELFNVKRGGTYSNIWALEVKDPGSTLPRVPYAVAVPTPKPLFVVTVTLLATSAAIVLTFRGSGRGGGVSDLKGMSVLQWSPVWAQRRRLQVVWHCSLSVCDCSQALYQSTSTKICSNPGVRNLNFFLSWLRLRLGVTFATHSAILN